jgi:hypothetical protein
MHAMLLETVDIPQADVIWHVARVPEAVARGAATIEAIGAYLGAKVPRQGHYYTQAARVLGLVEAVSQSGEVVLSPYGKAFVRYDRPSQQRALRHRMLLCEPMRSVIVALIGAGGDLDLDGIASVLQRLAPLSASTARRRAQTISAWLRDLNMAALRDGRLRYVGPRLLAGGSFDQPPARAGAAGPG